MSATVAPTDEVLPLNLSLSVKTLLLRYTTSNTVPETAETTLATALLSSPTNFSPITKSAVVWFGPLMVVRVTVGKFGSF